MMGAFDEKLKIRAEEAENIIAKYIRGDIPEYVSLEIQ